MVAMSVEDGTTSTVINEGDRDTIVKDAKFQERRQNRRRRDRARELIVLVVGFHHSRGPEIEFCLCDHMNEEGRPHIRKDDWGLLPFMALPDGAHLSTEDFSYFTLRREADVVSNAATNPHEGSDESESNSVTEEYASTPGSNSSKEGASRETSLFGISCVRQIETSMLLKCPPDVTRSSVQKAIVVIGDEPRYLGQLREKLSVVTLAWFSQRDFSDIDILKKFRENLVMGFDKDLLLKEANFGLSLREMIHEFKHHILILFKALLLQPKMLFFDTRCERPCMMQFSLISLIPGLLGHLEDCSCPSLNSHAETVTKPTSLKSSDRNSVLAFMGLPIQIFGKGAIFGPYTPLQKLDLLADYGTKSYVVGSTNSLLLQQKDRYSDILVNLAQGTVHVLSPSLQKALALTPADHRWMEFLMQTINDTWDEAHPERPKRHEYLGSDEFIRNQFEEYLLSLLSTVKYHEAINRDPSLSLSSSTASLASPTGQEPDEKTKGLAADGDASSSQADFNAEYIERWRSTPSFALFHRLTSDSPLYPIVVEPRHPCAGASGLDDIRRKIAQQVNELHIDERMREGREALNKQWEAGQRKVTSMFSYLWNDSESQAQSGTSETTSIANETASATEGGEEKRKHNMDREQKARSSSDSKASRIHDLDIPKNNHTESSRNPAVPEISTKSSSSTAAASSQPSSSSSTPTTTQRATSYFNSWTTWASEKKKEWSAKRSSLSQTSTSTTPTTEESPTALSIPRSRASNSSSRSKRRSLSRSSTSPSLDSNAGATTTTGGRSPHSQTQVQAQSQSPGDNKRLSRSSTLSRSSARMRISSIFTRRTSGHESTKSSSPPESSSSSKTTWPMKTPVSSSLPAPLSSGETPNETLSPQKKSSEGKSRPASSILFSADGTDDDDENAKRTNHGREEKKKTKHMKLPPSDNTSTRPSTSSSSSSSSSAETKPSHPGPGPGPAAPHRPPDSPSSSDASSVASDVSSLTHSDISPSSESRPPRRRSTATTRRHHSGGDADKSPRPDHQRSTSQNSCSLHQDDDNGDHNSESDKTGRE